MSLRFGMTRALIRVWLLDSSPSDDDTTVFLTSSLQLIWCELKHLFLRLMRRRSSLYIVLLDRLANVWEIDMNSIHAVDTRTYDNTIASTACSLQIQMAFGTRASQMAIRATEADGLRTNSWRKWKELSWPRQCRNVSLLIKLFVLWNNVRQVLLTLPRSPDKHIMFTNSMNPLALQAQWILGGPESPCYVGHSTKERTERNSDTMRNEGYSFPWLIPWQLFCLDTRSPRL